MSAPDVLPPFVVSLNRLLLGLAVWALCACGLHYAGLAPAWRAKALPMMTHVCVVRNHAPEGIRWQDWQAQRLPLCLADTDYQPPQSPFSLRLRRHGDVFRLSTTSDSLSDPWESEYRLNTDGSVTPLRYRFGGMTAWMTSAMLGGVAAVIVFRLLLWRLGKTRCRRYFTKPIKTPAEKQPET